MGCLCETSMTRLDSYTGRSDGCTVEGTAAAEAANLLDDTLRLVSASAEDKRAAEADLQAAVAAKAEAEAVAAIAATLEADRQATG
jgi:hypothetical protein